MAVATASQIKTALATHLKMAEAELATSWTPIIARAAIFAEFEVKGRLLARGFRLIEDILLFDRLEEFTLDLGCWKAIMSGGVYAGFDPAALATLDRRAELASVYVFVNGDLVQTKPAMGAPGTTMTSGPMAQDPNGVFDWDGSDETHRGIPW